MTNLINMSISQLIQGMKQNKFSPTEIIQSYSKEINNSKALKIFISTTLEKAKKMANESTLRYQNGTNRPLEGIPFAIKDLFCTKGIPTTAGSKMLQNFIPSYESTVTARMMDQGAIPVGKTACDEFAMGSSNETCYYGMPINPWRDNNGTKLVPGGSSGGSAACVAASLAPIALATDTGGSIRQPASFTGTVGLKPTYGRVSRWGTVAFASSLDQAGPITKNVRDNCLVMSAISGHDILDSTSLQASVPNYAAALGSSIKGLKIGLLQEFEVDNLPDSISYYWNEAAKHFEKAGAKCKKISIPNIMASLPAYYIIAPAEASSNLARYDGVRYGFRAPEEDINSMYSATRTQGFGEEVKRRILIGTYVLSSGHYDQYYSKAQQIRNLIFQEWEEAFKQVDVVLSPTTPNPAFGFNAKLDPISMYQNDLFTTSINLAGLPAISVPAGLDNNGKPIGLQLIGPRLEESRLFNLAYILEKAFSFKCEPEKWWLNKN